MLFSVIYERNCPGLTGELPPPTDCPEWDQTEGSEQYDGEGEGTHGKWCALLNRKEFEQFVDEAALYAQDVETLGSLGAPGFGFGLVPAISFRDYGGHEEWRSAYVRP